MKDKFYEGQKVVITGNTNGHFHEIGEVVELERAKFLFFENGEEYWDLKSDRWHFDSDDCVPFEEVSVNED
ncbi:hypothetical protein [Priestia aryabhattai]|uniref:hypothetical protein n=1 Tax=Priestia aryabhattai TaxID=412384 RepID=UPI002E1F3AC8|nr:hypothetical protein [Priestia aryabhattai]